MRAALCLCPCDSTSPSSQYITLWSSAARSGWGIAGVFVDGIDSPELHRLIAHREIDVVLAWRGDRLSYALQVELRAAGVGLYSHEPAARPPDAELDDQKGIVDDRRPGRPRVAPDVEAAIRAALAAGHGIRATARAAGVGLSVIQRVRAERSGQAGSA
jgi:hypothetical protein